MAGKGGFNVQVTGLDGLRLAMLAQGNPKKIDKAIQTAARKAAQPIVETMRLKAPVRTGRLRKAIRGYNARYEKPGAIATIRPGKKRNDPAGAYYRYIVVSGVPARGISARPFVDEAFAARQNDAEEIFQQTIDDLITSKLVSKRGPRR